MESYRLAAGRQLEPRLHIFDWKEAARGSRAREVTCRIQKWNIKTEGFHPILVANARVDWLAMDDDDITQKFPILLEGILQDVYSQRAASAWQGAQPQKLTVSMLLPGTSSAAEWRDLLQSRRQFWPTLTTRHETCLSRMMMQLPPAQMANRDGDAGMETMLWDIKIIPNELDNGYLMLPPGVLHMSALGRF